MTSVNARQFNTRLPSGLSSEMDARIKSGHDEYGWSTRSLTVIARGSDSVAERWRGRLFAQERRNERDRPSRPLVPEPVTPGPYHSTLNTSCRQSYTRRQLC